MKKYWKIVSVLVLLILICIFYFGKKDEIHNILDPTNTKIEIETSTFEFGSMKLHDTLRHTFMVKNVSKKELLIKNVLSNCECTIVSFDKNPIRQNETTKISVEFIPISKGNTEKDVVIEANTAPPFTVLSLKGKVE